MTMLPVGYTQDLDHRYMTPPSLRVFAVRETASGDRVYHWHFRVTAPNVGQIPTPTLHSLEHFCLDYFLAREPRIAGFAPMGCQTGYYLIAIGMGDFEDVAALVAEALESVEEATEVPHANVVHCGAAFNHSLPGAKALAQWLLDRRDVWQHAGPPGIEVGLPDVHRAGG